MRFRLDKVCTEHHIFKNTEFGAMYIEIQDNNLSSPADTAIIISVAAHQTVHNCQISAVDLQL
jgi:hypothetical protein